MSASAHARLWLLGPAAQRLFAQRLPHILSGTRIALGVSWRVLVAAEMVVGSGEGLGFAIIQSRWTMDYVSRLRLHHYHRPHRTGP